MTLLAILVAFGLFFGFFAGLAALLPQLEAVFAKSLDRRTAAPALPIFRAEAADQIAA
jgi:hypothetical protein